MEGNVWAQLFVRGVTFLSSLFASSTGVQKLESPTSSPNVPASDVDFSSTSKTIRAKPSLLKIMRNPSQTTGAGVSGVMVCSDGWSCFTLENRELLIPAGTYSIEITYSPHFGKEMPLLDGTSPRTDIRIHPANWPTQLEGCIAVGQSLDGDSLSNSELAFERVFGIIKDGIAKGGISVQISNGIS